MADLKARTPPHLQWDVAPIWPQSGPNIAKPLPPIWPQLAVLESKLAEDVNEHVSDFKARTPPHFSRMLTPSWSQTGQNKSSPCEVAWVSCLLIPSLVCLFAFLLYRWLSSFLVFCLIVGLLTCFRRRLLVCLLACLLTCLLACLLN